METKEIVIGNKLIAEFYYKDAVLQPKTCEGSIVSWGNYHTSWDWLMPVVEKIERLDLSFMAKNYSWYLGDVARFYMLHKRCMVNVGNLTLANIFQTDRRLENTWYCVVGFIRWYDTQSK